MNKKDVMRKSVEELKRKRYEVKCEIERDDISPKRRRDLKAYLHRIEKDLQTFGVYRKQYLANMNGRQP